MASGSVKRSVNCAADFSYLQISKMNSFVFCVVIKNDKRQIHVFDFNDFEVRHALRAVKYY
jgi:hypothetical protein